jgi:hypothetical protein
METANARDGETALTARVGGLRPSVAVFAILGVAVSVAASLYVLRYAAEAPEVNAIVRGIMALTALAVGLYLWQRQPHIRYGPVLAAAVFFLSPMALAVSEDPWTFTIGRTMGAVAIVYAVFLALIFPDGRPEDKGARLVLAATVAASGVVWTAALVLAETLPAGGPFIPCFDDCPNNAARVVEISPDPSNVLVLFPFMICVGLIRDRVLAASALEELVERLGPERSPAGVEEAMRDASLKLLLWSSSKSSYVDVRGGRVHLPEDDAGRSVTRIDRDRRPVAAIVHDRPSTATGLDPSGCLRRADGDGERPPRGRPADDRVVDSPRCVEPGYKDAGLAG